MQNLYSLIENEIFLGDRLSSGEFAILLNPGQFVSPNLKEKAGTDDMYIQYDLTNQAFDTSFLAKSLPKTISKTFNEVLFFAALPKNSLSSAQQKRIGELQQQTAQWEGAYNEYAGRYSDAEDALEQEQNSQDPSPAKLRRLQQQVQSAENAWEIDGYKLQFENAMAEYRQLLSGDPTTFWDGIKQKFKSTSSAHRGDYYATFFVPPVSVWGDSSTSWASLKRTVDDSHSTSVSHSTSWSGGASAGWGLWSFGGGASGSTTYQHTESDTSNLSISLDYLRVRIDRSSWLTPDVFSYHFWQFNKSHGQRLLSDGGNLDVVPPIRPVGDMPFLPTHLIVVKNVKLSGAFGHNDQTFIASQFQSNVSFGWGPFSVSGSYQESNSQQTVNGHFDGGTLTIPNPQIFAFVGTLLPKSPDPDPSLPWGNDIPAFGAIQPEQMRELAIARLHDRALLIEQRVKNEAYWKGLHLARESTSLAAKKGIQARMDFLEHELLKLT